MQVDMGRMTDVMTLAMAFAPGRCDIGSEVCAVGADDESWGVAVSRTGTVEALVIDSRSRRILRVVLDELDRQEGDDDEQDA